jgi:hypothetical protein
LAGAVEALQQLLEHETRGEDSLQGAQRPPEPIDLGNRRSGSIPPEGEGPDAGVNEKAHGAFADSFRERSSL